MSKKENPASGGTLDGADSEIAGRDDGINNTATTSVQPAVAATFFEALFAHTEHQIWLCSLPNEKGDKSTGPEDHIRTRDTTEIADFVVRLNDPARSTYFCVGTIQGRKRNKTTVRELPCLHVDIDFKQVIDDEAAILRRLRGMTLSPSIIVRSGHGLHCYWMLVEPMSVEEVDRIEATLKLLCDLVGGDQKVTQISALMRVPGSINSKACKDGGDAVAVTIIENNEIWFKFEHIEEMLTKTSPFVLRKAREQERTVRQSTNLFFEYGERTGYTVPLDVEKRLGNMMFMGGGDSSIHGTQISVTASMLNSGVELETVVALVLKATKVASGDHGKRWDWQAEQRNIRDMCATWIKKHPPGGKPTMPTNVAPRKVPRIAGEPDWRERRNNGSPLPSMHNARLAITALGVQCSRDTFHNKMLFGFADDTVKHELQSLVGEVSDDAIIALRQKMSDKFGFDLEDKATRDAVKSLALQHCFDPVCDLIDKAEADWDGVERLDSAVVDYFNCADTPLNRAFMRKTIIAMIARARNPGCKFDTITVLESAEGYNKSTAWRVLAGDENFSDEPIIGKGSREVQEQLAGVWVHENAELAGMRKADIDLVKAFASRMVDRARAAFAYFQREQPRHSIEVGSTNSDEYLQSQTGNRRFWPLPVLKAIDVVRLRADRLLLIGEAARCQSAGESITLDEAMWPDAAVVQEGRRIKDAWEDVLDDIPTDIEVVDYSDGSRKKQPIRQLVDGGDSRVASLDLLTHILGIPPGQQTTAHSMRLSVVMKRLGWRRDGNKITIRGKQVRGFSKPKPKGGLF